MINTSAQWYNYNSSAKNFVEGRGNQIWRHNIKLEVVDNKEAPVTHFTRNHFLDE